MSDARQSTGGPPPMPPRPSGRMTVSTFSPEADPQVRPRESSFGEASTSPRSSTSGGSSIRKPLPPVPRVVPGAIVAPTPPATAAQQSALSGKESYDVTLTPPQLYSDLPSSGHHHPLPPPKSEKADSLAKLAGELAPSTASVAKLPPIASAHPLISHTHFSLPVVPANSKPAAYVPAIPLPTYPAPTPSAQSPTGRPAALSSGTPMIKPPPAPAPIPIPILENSYDQMPPPKIEVPSNRDSKRQTLRSPFEQLLHLKVDDLSKNPRLSMSLSSKIRTMERVNSADTRSQDTLLLAIALVGFALPLEPLDPEGFGADEEKAEHKRVEALYRGKTLACYPSSRASLLPTHLWMSCMPHGFAFYKEAPSSQMFPFVCTNVDATRLYGACLVYYEEVDISSLDTIPANMAGQDHAFAARCLCLLAKVPMHATFREILSQLWGSLLESKDKPLSHPLEDYLTQALSLPNPRPGVRLTYTFLGKVLAWGSPPVGQLPIANIPMCYLFECLHLRHIISLFAAILLEEKVLLLSKRSSILTYVTETLVTLMWPFTWQHVYIPILPDLLRGFTMSPTPFLIGSHPGNFSADALKEMLDQGIVIVNLDLGTLAYSGPRRLELPAQEKDKLVANLEDIISPDLSTIDDPIKAPASSYARLNPHSSKGLGPYNDCLQIAFVRFWTSLFRKYRRYFRYLRVVPQPVVIFNKAAFAVSRPESEAFLTDYMETQAFAVFLEERKWPSSDLFDELITSRKYKQDVAQIVAQLREPDQINMDTPTFSSPAGAHTYFSWPEKLATDRIRALVDPAIVIKLNVTEKPPAPVIHYTLRPSGGNRRARITPEAGYELRAVREKVNHFVQELLSEKEGRVQDFTNETELLRSSEHARTEFALRLSEKSKVLTDTAFSSLAYFIGVCVRAAGAIKDYSSPVALLDVCFHFHRINAKFEAEFIAQRVRNESLWLTIPFWESQFFDLMESECKKLYGEDISWKLEEFRILDNELKLKVIATEENVVFGRLSNLAYRMLSLGVTISQTRRFIDRMCSFASLNEEQTGLLMDLLSNMSKTLPELEESSGPALMRTSVADAEKAPDTNFISVGGYDRVNAPAKPARTQYTVRQFKGHTEGVLCLETVRDKLISGGADNTVRVHQFFCLSFAHHEEVWNATTGECLTTLSGHLGWVSCVCLIRPKDPTETKIISGSYDNDLRLWDMNGKKVRAFQGHTGSISCLKPRDSTSPLVFSGSYDNTVRFWDARTKKASHIYRGHTAAVLSIEFDGYQFISGSRDHTARLWDFRTGKPLQTLTGHTDWVRGVVCDGIGKAVTCSNDRTVRQWFGTGESINTITGHLGAVNCIHVDSKYIVSGSADATLMVWEKKSGLFVQKYAEHTDEVLLVRPFLSHFLASASFDGTLRVWPYLDNIRSAKTIVSVNAHTKRITDLRVDGPRLFSSSWDKEIKCWEFPLDLES